MDQIFQNHIEIIIRGSESYHAMVSDISTEILIGLKKALNPDQSSNSEWLSLEEAKKILHYQSKKKWKALRDNGEIEFSRIGKPFVYKKESLFKYIDKRSNSIKKRKPSVY